MRAVAENPNTPPSALERIARRRVPGTAGALARNPHTPPWALACLAEDPDPEVREAVAENPSTPWETVKGLFANPEPTVWETVLYREDLTLERIEELEMEVTLRVLAGEDFPGKVRLLEKLKEARKKGEPFFLTLEERLEALEDYPYKDDLPF